MPDLSIETLVASYTAANLTRLDSVSYFYALCFDHRRKKRTGTAVEVEVNMGCCSVCRLLQYGDIVD